MIAGRPVVSTSHANRVGTSPVRSPAALYGTLTHRPEPLSAPYPVETNQLSHNGLNVAYRATVCRTIGASPLILYLVHRLAVAWSVEKQAKQNGPYPKVIVFMFGRLCPAGFVVLPHGFVINSVGLHVGDTRFGALGMCLRGSGKSEDRHQTQYAYGRASAHSVAGLHHLFGFCMSLSVEPRHGANEAGRVERYIPTGPGARLRRPMARLRHDIFRPFVHDRTALVK